MEPRDTSVESFISENDSGRIGERQQQALDIVRRYGPMSAAEVGDRARKENGLDVWVDFSSRLSELRDAGLVSEAGNQECPITHKTVISWVASKDAPNPTERPKRETRKQEVARLNDEIASLRAEVKSLKALVKAQGTFVW